MILVHQCFTSFFRLIICFRSKFQSKDVLFNVYHDYSVTYFHIENYLQLSIYVLKEYNYSEYILFINKILRNYINFIFTFDHDILKGTYDEI